MRIVLNGGASWRLISGQIGNFCPKHRFVLGNSLSTSAFVIKIGLPAPG